MAGTLRFDQASSELTESTMRTLGVFCAFLFVVSTPILAQTADPCIGTKTDQPTEPTVRYPSSPFTVTIFMLERPAAQTPNGSTAHGLVTTPLAGSLIGLSSQPPIVASPLTGSLLAPIIGPSGIVQP